VGKPHFFVKKFVATIVVHLAAILVRLWIPVGRSWWNGYPICNFNAHITAWYHKDSLSRHLTGLAYPSLTVWVLDKWRHERFLIIARLAHIAMLLIASNDAVQ
jgi:hypothetical protein